MQRLFIAALLCFCGLNCGCGGSAQVPTLTLHDFNAEHAAQLVEVGERFYLAASADELHAAVADAQKIDPNAAITHELEAILASYEIGNSNEAFLKALESRDDDGALMHMNSLDRLSMTEEQEHRCLAILKAQSETHHSPTVRAVARVNLEKMLHWLGQADQNNSSDFKDYIPLSLIGPWNNDQGKGFDIEEAPEREIDLSARYPGNILEVGWLSDYPISQPGIVELDEIISPDAWQFAYAASAISVEESANYTLRIATSDPIKVFVNDTLVFESRRWNSFVPDSIALPIWLRKGANRILLKTAHKTGDWTISARLTMPDGTPAPFKSLPADTPIAEGATPQSVDEISILLNNYQDLQGEARKIYHGIRWLHELRDERERLSLAENFAQAAPQSIVAQVSLASALMDNGELGRALSLTERLAKEHQSLPMLRYLQAFLEANQNYDQKAREHLQALKADSPKIYQSFHLLSQMYGHMQWSEERLNLLREAENHWPEYLGLLNVLSDAEAELGHYDKAALYIDKILKRGPASYGALLKRSELAIQQGDLKSAKLYANRALQAWPGRREPYINLAKIERLEGNFEAAEKTLEKLTKFAPTSAEPWRMIALTELERGNTQAAIPALQAALKRAPEDESLLSRLENIAPESGAWLSDVPSEELIDQLLLAQSRTQDSSKPFHILLDDEVSVLHPDGSMSNVVTTVATVQNQDGLDQLTQQNLRRGGITRVLLAYAVSPDGEKIGASTIRGREVRFANLQIGSTTVLQYRTDEPQDRLLAGHIARNWWFNSGVDVDVSRWVLTAPENVVLHEKLSAISDVQKAVENLDGQRRYTWIAHDQKSQQYEASMPSFFEVQPNLQVTTVPSWDMFAQWEFALLEDVFRKTPEVSALAQELAKDTETKEEKLLNIFEYLIRHIRYQQDYEHIIAGVKPHTASQILSRQYGDCKDKAVLFIALARELGIEAHFALIRTHDQGPIAEEIPAQQFNHAIVYVPKQEGFSEARFFDSTVDALDLVSLRDDDQGTRSFVIDPEKRTWSFIDVPVQAAEIDTLTIASQATLSSDGSLNGDSTLTAQGSLGQMFRQQVRTESSFKKFTEFTIKELLGGAQIENSEAISVDSLREPAQLHMAFNMPTFARKEGKTLRFSPINGLQPKKLFPTTDRAFPYEFHTHRMFSWQTQIALPKGARLQKKPADQNLTSPCMTFTQSTKVQNGVLTTNHEIRYTCERFEASEWDSYRNLAQSIDQALKDEIVISL